MMETITQDLELQLTSDPELSYSPLMNVLSQTGLGRSH